MLYYLLHQSDIWSDIKPDGKRNVRILFLALVLYIFIHALVYELKDKSPMFKILHGYFFYFILIDIFCSCITYRQYYGRSILNELGNNTKHVYDKDRHLYYEANSSQGKAYFEMQDKKLKDEIEQREIEINKLKADIEELQLQPGGAEFLKAQEHFYQTAAEQMKPDNNDITNNEDNKSNKS